MQQRQLRLGDTLDDYCPRERRLTNHSVVAMIGDDIKRTRCNTCEAEHEYKHAKVPRQRKKGEEPAALYAQALANGPRISHDPLEGKPPDGQPQASGEPEDGSLSSELHSSECEPELHDVDTDEAEDAVGNEEVDVDGDVEEGPVHRQLIRATLPRHEGQAPPSRPTPDFTIRQPGGGRPGRFRPRNSQHGGGGQMFQGNRSAGPGGGGGRNQGRHPGNRPPQGQGNARPGRRHDVGRKRSK